MTICDDKTIIKSNIGKRVRALRKEQNLTQKSLGLMVGIDRSYISCIERGTRNVSIDNLVKLSRGFGISLPELFEGVDPQAPSAGASYAYTRIPNA